MLDAGDRIDRYVIESLLGEGGMGQVYLARDTQLRRPMPMPKADADTGAEDRCRRRGASASASV